LLASVNSSTHTDLGVNKRRPLVAFVGLVLLLLLLGTAPGVSAQSADDPASIVDAYSSALNAHDLPAALALFDPNGSATDVHGRHYEGRGGLTEFLLANGFGPTARVRTNNLQVVGNRALWTYICTCTVSATDVRVVLSHNKIIVFFMTPTGAGATTRSVASGPSAALWLAALALLVAVLLMGRGAFSVRQPAPPRRPAQGRLLAGLARTFVAEPPHAPSPSPATERGSFYSV
jgi:hypothetical protein